MSLENRDKPRRRYDEAFKRNAVDLLLRGDRTLASIARELGVSVGMLHRWRQNCAGRPGKVVTGPKTLDEATQEIGRLRAELARMQEREVVLKKSLGILSETPGSGMPRSMH